MVGPRFFQDSRRLGEIRGQELAGACVWLVLRLAPVPWKVLVSVWGRGLRWAKRTLHGCGHPRGLHDAQNSSYNHAAPVPVPPSCGQKG